MQLSEFLLQSPSSLCVSSWWPGERSGSSTLTVPLSPREEQAEPALPQPYLLENLATEAEHRGEMIDSNIKAETVHGEHGACCARM